jgi:hypothetical protein
MFENVKGCEQHCFDKYPVVSSYLNINKFQCVFRVPECGTMKNRQGRVGIQLHQRRRCRRRGRD